MKPIATNSKAKTMEEKSNPNVADPNEKRMQTKFKCVIANPKDTLYS